MKTKKISTKFELKDCKELDHADCGHPDVYASEPTHTPTPWWTEKSEGYNKAYYLMGAQDPEGEEGNGTCIGSVYDISKKDAAFIVRAVNAHDEVLAFLKFLEAGVEDRISIAEMPSEEELTKRLKAAIAKMEGR